jgi:LacI family transcriptional regulator
MRDVARQAGVSVSTVSHVINKTRTVNETTRRRVLEAMNELGYKPNALARSLRRQRTNTLGVILPDIADPFLAEIARAIEGASFAHNYSLILCNSEGDSEKQLAYTNALIEKQVVGIFFVAAGVRAELVEDLQGRKVPLVLIDPEVSGLEVDTVLTDQAQGGRLATQHLIDLGHERIACISGEPERSSSTERVAGYHQALRQNHTPFDERLVVTSNFQYEGGYEATQRLLALDERPTAIFAGNDLMAVGCIRAATELGRRVPESLSVAGFGDVRLASFTNPPLTTVAQPIYRLGALATEMLLERISGLDSPPRFSKVETELRVRGSTTSLKGTQLRLF